MFFEVSAEEAGIGKMILPGNLLDALRSALELHLGLQDNVLVDDDLGRVTGYLANDVGEIFRGNVHQRGVIVDVAGELVITLHQHHEMIEEFTHTIRLHLVGTILRIALQVLVETNEECLQLAEHQLGDAGAFRLVEINLQQGKHVVDDIGNHGRILAASVFTQGGIHRLLKLQARLTKQGRIVLQHFHLEDGRTF